MVSISKILISNIFDIMLYYVKNITFSILEILKRELRSLSWRERGFGK